MFPQKYLKMLRYLRLVRLTNINGLAYFVYFWSLKDNLTGNRWDHASDINNHHYNWNIIWQPILKMFIITAKVRGWTKRDRFYFDMRYFHIIKVNNVIISTPNQRNDLNPILTRTTRILHLTLSITPTSSWNHFITFCDLSEGKIIDTLLINVVRPSWGMQGTQPR